MLIDVTARWGLPLGAIVSPMAADAAPVPMVDFGNSTIVRCRKCRTYINPFVQWTDGGRRFRCNLCGSLTEVRTNSSHLTALVSPGIPNR